MSTTEPVDAHGNTCNPTKSPCDRYVFNTVLTRAKSLVVVVGSPLVLLNIEDQMAKLYKDKGKCWSLYLKSCIEKNTFIIPPTVGDNEQVRQNFKAKLATRLGIGTTVRPSSARKPLSSKAPLPALPSKFELQSPTKLTSQSPPSKAQPRVVSPQKVNAQPPSQPKLLYPTTAPVGSEHSFSKPVIKHSSPPLTAKGSKAGTPLTAVKSPSPQVQSGTSSLRATNVQPKLSPKEGPKLKPAENLSSVSAKMKSKPATTQQRSHPKKGITSIMYICYVMSYIHVPAINYYRESKGSSCILHTPSL